MVHELNIELSVVLEEEKEEALYNFLCEELDYNGEFVVLDEETVEEYLIKTQEYMIWAYKSSFIMDYLKADVVEGLGDLDIKELRKSIETAQEKLCESANGLIKGLTDWKELIVEVGNLDGRGAFISTYDGEEHEIEFEGMDLLVYKC